MVFQECSRPCQLCKPEKDVHETTEFLELFLRNLLLDEKNSPRNRDLHISRIPKCQDVTLGEKVVLDFLKNDGKLTQKKLGELIGESDRRVKRIISSLEEKGHITRVGRKRYGFRQVN